MMLVENRHYCCTKCAATAEEAEEEAAKRIAAEQLKHTHFRFMADVVGG